MDFNAEDAYHYTNGVNYPVGWGALESLLFRTRGGREETAGPNHFGIRRKG